MFVKRRLEMLGWILFVICALLYLYGGIVAGDPLVISGSMVFLLACFIFIYATLKSKKDRKIDSDRSYDDP